MVPHESDQNLEWRVIRQQQNIIFITSTSPINSKAKVYIYINLIVNIQAVGKTYNQISDKVTSK